MRDAKKSLHNLKIKYPNANFNITSQKDYSNNTLKFPISIGGPKAGRSIVKTALAAASLLEIDPLICNVAQTT